MDDLMQCKFWFMYPMLPNGVAQCKEFDQLAWITKFVILTNKNGDDVAKGICHSINADLVVKNNGQQLGNDSVAIQIAKSLCKEDVPLEWMFYMGA